MSPTHGAGALSARLLVGAALVSATVLGGTSAAFAQTFAAPNASGDNGTVKIHNPSTSEEDNRNEPKVCDFQIVADNFDAVQEVSWEILVKGDKGGWRDVVLEGDLVLDDEGSGSTEILALDDGHYKLDWTFEGQKSNDAKHKVFKVVCEDPEEEPEPTPGPGEEPSTPPGEEESPGEEPSDEPTDPAVPEETDEQVDPTDPADTTDPADSEGPESGDEESPAADESSSSLPVTGSALAGLAAAGIVAVAGGGAAVYFSRRRKSADSQE